MHHLRAIARHTDRQLGLVTRAQALRCGLTDAQLRTLVRAGVLVRVHAGVYRLAGSQPSPERRALAACLACGDGAYASHLTSGGLWAIIDPSEGSVDVTVTSGSHRAPSGVHVHRSRILSRSDRTRLGSVPLTSPKRALLELASVLAPPDLETAADRLFRRGLATPQQTLGYLEQPHLRGARGRCGLLQLVADRATLGVPGSNLESKAIAVIRSFGLPAPVRQHDVRIHGRMLHFDLAYPDHRVAIELDGRAPHWGREQWQTDHDRRNLTELEDWRMLGFTWWDVDERPDWFALALGRTLGLRPSRWRRDDSRR